MNWILLAPLAAIGLVVYAIAAVNGDNNGYKHGEQRFHDLLMQLQEQNKRLMVESALNLCYADGLEQALEWKYADIAERDAKINALQMQTVEMPDVSALQEELQIARAALLLEQKATPKRGGRGKQKEVVSE